MIKRKLIDELRKLMKVFPVVGITGPRQVGKTTLIQKLATSSETQPLFLNGDDPDVRSLLSNASSSQLKTLVGDYEIIIIDEAQRISNIGLTLKILIDNHKNRQIL